MAPPWDALLQPVPDDVQKVPSMMSPGERQFLYHLAKDYYVGEGMIVDAGLFLGASTRCFGAGLSSNSCCALSVFKFTRPIVSIDLAVVTKSMIRSLTRHGVGADLVPGDSFASIIESNIVPVRDLVELRIGDVAEHGRVDGQIEILFLDLLKQDDISRFALREWFHRLIPGRSVVIQQDYFFEGLPFLKYHQEYFASKFAYLGELGSSAIYRCVERITEEDVELCIRETSDPDTQLRLSALPIYRTRDRGRQLMMAISHLALMESISDGADCEEFRRHIQYEYRDVLDSDLPQRRGERLRTRAGRYGFDFAGRDA